MDKEKFDSIDHAFRDGELKDESYSDNNDVIFNLAPYDQINYSEFGFIKSDMPLTYDIIKRRVQSHHRKYGFSLNNRYSYSNRENRFIARELKIGEFHYYSELNKEIVYNQTMKPENILLQSIYREDVSPDTITFDQWIDKINNKFKELRKEYFYEKASSMVLRNLPASTRKNEIKACISALVWGDESNPDLNLLTKYLWIMKYNGFTVKPKQVEKISDSMKMRRKVGNQWGQVQLIY